MSHLKGAVLIDDNNNVEDSLETVRDMMTKNGNYYVVYKIIANTWQSATQNSGPQCFCYITWNFVATARDARQSVPDGHFYLEIFRSLNQ